MTMYVGRADALERYGEELVGRLQRLQRENPWCWHRMGVQVEERPGAKALSEGSIVHWLEESRDATPQN